jgi:aryl-alcohol dehydrogenase-like predicted oxidoreductase
MTSFRRHGLERSKPLLTAIEEIAQAYGVTASQVALNWLVHSSGDTVVVIPGATNAAQATENAAAMNFRLRDTELKRLDALSRPFC